MATLDLLLPLPYIFCKSLWPPLVFTRVANPCDPKGCLVRTSFKALVLGVPLFLGHFLLMEGPFWDPFGRGSFFRGLLFRKARGPLGRGSLLGARGPFLGSFVIGPFLGSLC